MKRPSRRQVLIATAATGAAATGITAGVAWYNDDRSSTVLDLDLDDEVRWAAFKEHLRHRLPYLQLPETTIDAFIADHVANGKRVPKRSGALSDLRKTFMLSTDFFLKDGDESRPLAYVAYFDPYITPCWNPLLKA